MAVSLYMDQHVHRAITDALRRQSVDVLTAYDDGTSTLADTELLDRASALGRVLFSRDSDLIIEATRRQRLGIPFGGVIFAHLLGTPIGTCIEDLALIALASEPDELRDRIIYLPL